MKNYYLAVDIGASSGSHFRTHRRRTDDFGRGIPLSKRNGK